MTNVKLNKSVKEIIDVFQKKKFVKLTISDIKAEIGGESNTINQRINRNKEFFSISNTRPIKIRLLPGKIPTIAYLNNNQCLFCKKTYAIDQFHLVYKDSNKKNNSWTNVTIRCDDCRKKKKKSLPAAPKKSKPKKPKTPKKSTKKAKPKPKYPKWEYKTLIIEKTPEDYTETWGIFQTPEKFYFQFMEVDDINDIDEEDWSWIEDDDEEISSHSMSDILDFFGEDGWEVFKLDKIGDQVGFSEDDDDGDSRWEVYLKRKML